MEKDGTVKARITQRQAVLIARQNAWTNQHRSTRRMADTERKAFSPVAARWTIEGNAGLLIERVTAPVEHRPVLPAGCTMATIICRFFPSTRPLHTASSMA
ncbi:MAG: hypothetical protein LKE81_08985 [Acetobacter sp.]|nr:hypothetical protein [Acetobacter sp.]